MRASLVFLLVIASGCADQLPPGIPPVQVYVFDALNGSPLCNATVTINTTPAQEGEANTVNCYYIAAQQLDVGASYAVAAQAPGYGSGTTSGNVPSTGAKVLIPLTRTTPLDAGTDATTDANTDASESDATSDAMSEAGDATLD
jgi:hypothetical protein